MPIEIVDQTGSDEYPPDVNTVFDALQELVTAWLANGVSPEIITRGLAVCATQVVVRAGGSVPKLIEFVKKCADGYHAEMASAEAKANGTTS